MLIRTNIALVALVSVFVFCANVTTVVASASKAVSNVSSSKRASSTSDIPLAIKLERRKVAFIAGQEILQDATSAKPGDVLEDVATYTNKTNRVLVVPEATLPVPANTELILSSVKPVPVLASVDGINYFSLPLKTKATGANGVEVEKPVALSEYRFLRWYPGKLASMQSVTYSARFRVVDETDTTIVKR